MRSKPLPSIFGGKSLGLIVFHVAHASLPDSHSILKVPVVIELLGPSSRFRLHGIPQILPNIEEHDLGSFVKQQQQILQDAATDVSSQASSSVSSAGTIGSGSTPTHEVAKCPTEQSPAAEKSILARAKWSYIYFSSLLQEPEAKWKQSKEISHVYNTCADGVLAMEARGVSVIQLDSYRSNTGGVPSRGDVCWARLVGSL